MRPKHRDEDWQNTPLMELCDVYSELDIEETHQTELKNVPLPSTPVGNDFLAKTNLG
jgi:hypothetical protein